MMPAYQGMEYVYCCIIQSIYHNMPMLFSTVYSQPPIIMLALTWLNRVESRNGLFLTPTLSLALYPARSSLVLLFCILFAGSFFFFFARLCFFFLFSPLPDFRHPLFPHPPFPFFNYCTGASSRVPSTRSSGLATSLLGLVHGHVAELIPPLFF